MSEKKNTYTGGPAFPRAMGAAMTDCGGQYNDSQPGMTLRDWLAGQAIAGAASRSMLMDSELRGVAMSAYLLADAMLQARKG
jgi:hypothetical protein